jgi:fumarate reductase subunit C
MSASREPPVYTPYHPRWLRQRVSTYWWLGKPTYFLFILRELSCLFVAWLVVFLLMLVRAVNEGAESYERFLAWSAGGLVLALNVVTLAFVVLHTVTFFTASEQALVVRVGRRRVPGRVIVAGHYAAMVGASVLVIALLWGG